MAETETILNFSGRRQLPLIRQAESQECGLACLAMVAGWHGLQLDLVSLRRKFAISLKGTTLKHIIDIAAQIGLGARAVRCEPEDLLKLRKPCILHWEFKHFVVLKEVRRGFVWLHDPALGVRKLRLSEVSGLFTGVALELVPTESFEKKDKTSKLHILDLWRWSPGMRSALTQAIVLSLLLQLFMLLGPLYMQLVVDQAITKGDRGLLLVLATAFALVALFNVATSALRGLVMQYLANVQSYDMSSRLLHHLARLPLQYFQSRSLGDVVQRFHSIEPIKQFIINGGIGVIVDGLLSIVTGILMFTYSTTLGAISVGIVVIYAIARLSVLSWSRRLTTDVIVASTREQSQFLETVRAAQTIKVTGAESTREVEWRNLYAASINSGLKVGNLGIGFSSASGVLSGLSDIGVVYLAAISVIAGDMTVGMVTAFLAYKGQFTQRILGLVDQAVQYLMLQVYVDRVSDIALGATETGLDAEVNQDRKIDGAIAVRDLTFSYAQHEQPIFKNVSFDVVAREFVAIVGPSGAGKTTLLKVAMGLYHSSSGEVLVDGIPLSQLGHSTLRRQIGVVMQEDHLLAGTVAENIAIFSENIDMDHVRHCSKLAQVHDEISALPMQYNTLVGDMGSSLSSGQRQRVLIARALYRNPKVLIMDEGTAHVDPDCERRLIEMLRGLPITRIVVAHSRALAEASDRVLKLEGSNLTEVRGKSSIVAWEIDRNEPEEPPQLVEGFVT